MWPDIPVEELVPVASTLLETKMFLPRPRRGMVRRARLAQRLQPGTESTLMLVSAPAGFGKTTMLTEWLASELAPGDLLAAWLSLDAGDNAPTTFWTYVASALRKASPDVGGTALELLMAPQPPPIETVLTTLINDLSGLDQGVVFVLDDYHAIKAAEIHQGVAYLLDHRPPQLHTVIAGRADPPLPLARLRARGELVEVRAADLRFTAAETATYLNDVMGLGIRVQDVTALEERTEGWIAALKLAALSIQGRSDTAGFIAGFAGDDRYVVDYLVEEVLERQSDQDRVFLLRTAVLDRLSGHLCDAVTGQVGGRATLERLDRSNLFLVPLDDRREWYRYHHLFADVLRTRLVDEQPLLVPKLHRRASRWYAEHGERSAAIGHALAADDPDSAADLTEASVTEMMSRRQERTLREWLEALPEELVRNRPVLHMALVRVLMALEMPHGVEERLDDIERRLSRGMLGTVVDQDEYERLPASIELYRAALALMRGDGPGTVAHAQRSTELAPRDADVVRAGAAALRGLTSWAVGGLEDAHRAYTECMAGLQRAGFIADVLGCATTVSDIRVTQGRLEDALGTYQRALHLVADQGETVRGSADMHVGISQILRERGDLTGARRHLLRSQELGEPLGMPQNPYRWHLAMARLRQAEGDLAGAVTLLDEAERLFVPDFHPEVRPVAAWRARVWAAQGRIAEALDWATSRGLSAQDELSYLLEFEHVTLARALLAQHLVERGTGGALRDATGLLERLLTAAEEGGRIGTVLEVLVLLALAHHAHSERTVAFATLRRALTLAAPEHYVQVFVDEGSPMVEMLEAAEREGGTSRQLRRLLDGIDGAPARAKETIADPLTDRELAVLRMLGTELDGPEIARELVVSLNTVRTHTRNIYAKLGVTNRRAAVRRARELHLLRPGT
ncbi:MAG: LuxR C-terminal-related transcriptional regulator [Nocardioidaceae bacterium]